MIETQTPITSINDIYTLVKTDFDAINNLIVQHLDANDELIQKVGHHIIDSGGKRLRPLLVLLSSRALGYTGKKPIQLAVIIEFIHTVSLLHDDVVDHSELRRGIKTANAIWGNEASILVGDFLYSRAFQMMTELNSLEVMRILANTSNTIANAEVVQLAHCKDPTTTEATYLTIIQGKTAALFKAATELGAFISHADTTQQQALANYGNDLGMAFQIIDDLLDYTASTKKLGKNLGDDLAEGKLTLPLIHALQHASTADADLLKQAIQQEGKDQFDTVLSILKKTDSLNYTSKLAHTKSQTAINALQQLPPSDYRNALAFLADFATTRDH